jgi:hypothetical protein
MNVFVNCCAGGDIKQSLKNIVNVINRFSATDEEVMIAVESAMKAVRDDLRSQVAATSKKAKDLVGEVLSREVRLEFAHQEIRRLQHLNLRHTSAFQCPLAFIKQQERDDDRKRRNTEELQEAERKGHEGTAVAENVSQVLRFEKLFDSLNNN